VSKLFVHEIEKREKIKGIILDALKEKTTLEDVIYWTNGGNKNMNVGFLRQPLIGILIDWDEKRKKKKQPKK
jgi:hypothetical protein